MTHWSLAAGIGGAGPGPTGGGAALSLSSTGVLIFPPSMNFKGSPSGHPIMKTFEPSGKARGAISREAGTTPGAGLFTTSSSKTAMSEVVGMIVGSSKLGIHFVGYCAKS